MKINYPVKLWLLTLAAAPVLITISRQFFYVEDADFKPISTSAFALFFFMYIFGFFLSLPSLCLFWYLFDELQEREIKTVPKKAALAFTGVLLVLISFVIIGGKNVYSDLIWPISYCIPLVFFTFLLKMPAAKAAAEE